MEEKMEKKILSERVKNLENLLESKENYDMIIYSGEELNIQEIHVHSIILCCHSNYFRTAFSNNLVKKENEKYFLKIPNVTLENLNKIIRFLYCGQIDLTTENGTDIIKLLISVKELELQTLSDYIQEYLNNNQKEFVQNNLIELFELCNNNDDESFEILQKSCLKIICKNPNLLFEKEFFLTLSSKILLIILNQKNILLDEIEIWNNLIKWAYAQNPNIDSDLSKWTQQDIKMMKNTLHDLIPLIRFQDIGSEEFYDKIYPYENILPDDYKNKIMQYYLLSKETNEDFFLPSRLTTSTIINDEHFSIFSNWIEKKNDSYYTAINNPYEFELIYRASKYGNAPSIFHEKCDNKSNMIVVAKLVDSNKIVGGYNPLSWENCEKFQSTKDSFIFSFTDMNDLQSGKVGYSKFKNHSIYSEPGYGPAFGGGCDLICLNDGKWMSLSYTYPDINIPKNFNVEDYEVFHVVKEY
ncbi:BTB/POZ domain-containing protein [Rhizophagus irregularis DAOM 181602=DAOM 197198]|uniref:Kelch-like protein 17 n=2 Tax=Rhizophagus irregularis TaxID=588596 RepID=A0A015JD21_RHIIW|nr:BTB/POZ domain-containing protein [Rhizophagus irregularis DAOM 181602=DAOM 197198]EXX67397.1 hypothetical protein RirG_114750 [Rhizophagus irregularis DAOM 197198w]POG76195.1 BTB/POZ domain-containing protein [Rhizophagus irregularis DAOM 181602=DAOM 197198]GBC17562.2 BTB/POZ domain-containing protein [Rhizophagus irregularis DAOM 181602=DAOM 197198]|eukprot:XP_025183061.1 BTB/POZ domain-containing protein [Rhizophagus irregularis DAOM 181602=DAOM 197198]